MSLEQRSLLYSRSHDPNFKGAFFRTYTGILYQNQQNFNQTRFLLCKEKFLTIPVVIYVRKKFYLLHSFNELIYNLGASGLLGYWQSEIIDSRYLNIIDYHEPTAIELQHLSGGFMVLLLGALVALIAFVGEILHKKFWGQNQMIVM